MLRMLHSLPKPILFGLYGALGGLLGALLFGELLWRVACPTVAQAAPLRLAASPSVTAYWGGSNRIFVKIARSGFDGPVVVRANNLPADVTIHAIEIPKGEVDGELKVTMEANGEKPKSGAEITVEIQARGVDDAKAIDAVPLKLKVELPPTALLLSASPEVRLYEGGSNRFAVKIARQNFEGPVRIDALNLPPGVKIAEVVIPADKNEIDVVVTAERMSALLRPQPIRLRGSLPHNPDLSATAPIDIMVVAAPPQLTLAVSPQVVLYPGQKNKFTVKIARNRFEGAVAIEALRTADGIRIADATIPADKTEIEVEAASTSADETGLPKVQRVPIRGKAKLVDLEATSEIEVRIEPLPPSMNIAVSPIVNVTQGGKGKFVVKLARLGFKDAVQVNFANAPDGTTFPDAVIPANANEVEVEMRARFKTAIAKTPMVANAKAVGTKVADVKGDFVLDVAKAPPKSQGRADIIFVLDVTASMQKYIDGIRDGIQDFVVTLEDAEIDARIAMVAFRDLTDAFDKKAGTKAMQVLLFPDKPFTADYMLFRTEVGKLKAEGGGDLPESSMEAIAEAAKQPFRKDVTKIMILVTDAPPKLSGIPGKVILPTASVIKHAQVLLAKKALQDGKVNQLHLVARTDDRPVYELIQKGSPGKFYDLAAAAQGKKGFADFLPVLSKDIATTTAKSDALVAMSAPPMPPSSKGATNLPMVAAPAPPESSLPDAPKVKDVAPPTLADSVAPPSTEMPTMQGLLSTGSYDRRDQWQLLLATALQNAAVALGIGFVLVAGQKLYMSQRFLGFGEGTKSVIGGFLAGLFGGGLGQLLYQYSPESPILEAGTRILGWSLVGAIFGGGMSLFVPNLGMLRSIAGGTLGGAIGAVGFILAALVGELFGRMVGAVVVGFAIGMMVAFAELAFRRYWLEVAFGKHEIRTITLGSTPVTIGTATNAMIHVDAPKPITLAFRIERDRVVCLNLYAEKTFEVQPGHEARIGTVTVTMRSVEQARKVGFALCLSNQKEICLTEGMPLTAAELPGLDSQAADGMVLLVSAHPRDAKKLVLRNRSKQTWAARKSDGVTQEIAPGGSIELANGLRVNFGKIQATLKREGDGDA